MSKKIVDMETKDVSGGSGLLGGFVDLMSGGLTDGAKTYETKITTSDGKTYEGTSYTKERSIENARDNMNSSSDSDSDAGSDSSDSACYLTTACLSSRGLPDSCLELNILRNFRDNYMMNNSKGKEAVKEYYKFAPEIVASINSRADAKQIWEGVYKNLEHAVNLVMSKDFNGAFEHYKKMSLELKDIYLK